MTVGELRKLIADLPDNLPLLIGTTDHSYRVAEARSTTARYQKAGRFENWTEDYGEDMTPTAEYGEAKWVLVIT